MTPLYAFAKALFGTVVGLTNGFQVEGMENLPKSGPAIIVANHVSMWDPIVLGTVFPRHVAFMSKKELFERPIVAMVLRGLGAFRVKRGQSDRDAIRQALDVLKSGGLVGIFVEGTRNRSGKGFLQPQPGAAMLALKSGAPIIPVALLNTSRILKKLRIPVIVRVGIPMTDLKQGGTHRELYADTSTRIMDAIAQLYGA